MKKRTKKLLLPVGWSRFIAGQADQLGRPQDHLADNPSLKATRQAAIANAYRLAVLGAARETGLDVPAFATACPWTYPEITNPSFWPS